MAKFCTQCGTRCRPQQNFCSGCGYALTSPSSQINHTSTPGPERNEVRRPKQPERSTGAHVRARSPASGKGVLWLTGLLFVALAVAAYINDPSFAARRNVLMTLVAVSAFVFFIRPIVHALAFWWRIQAQIPRLIRWGLTFGISFYIGLRLGTGAGGKEWSTTLMSMTAGLLIGFLFLFRSSTGKAKLGA